MNMDDKPMSRNIILCDQIEKGSVKDAIKSILEINEDDNEKEKKQVGFKREPIKLYISSPGGGIYDGLALVGVIEMSKTPVHTIAVGWAMSMGFMILLAGHKRFAHRFATIMYHEASTWVWDKITSVKEDIVETERLQAIYDGYVLEKTKILMSSLADKKRTKSEWYIPADEALKLGIVDEVI